METNIWMTKDDNNHPKFIKIENMDNEHLQKAFAYCQKKQWLHHCKGMVFFELAESLEQEAEKRSITLNEIEHKSYKEKRFFKNSAKAL